jgi:hypothetical protein
MRRKLLALLAFIPLTTAVWVLVVGPSGVVFADLSPTIVIVVAIVSWFVVAVACWLVVLGLAWAVRRLSATVWMVAGLLALAGLLWPTSMLVERWRFPARLPQPLETLVTATVSSMPSLALIVAALLLYSGLTLTQERKGAGAAEGDATPARHKHAGRVAAICLVLSALLIAKTLYNLYWLTVWDNTTDSLGYFLLIIPILAALFSGTLLVLTLPGRAEWAGLYALLIPGLMIVVSARAQAVDYRWLTEERAGRVSHAVEAYYAREGLYPQDLRQLTPRYLLSVPRPIIMNGQGWCYDGGDSYYRLGYLDRENWMSGILIPRAYRTKGQVPDLPGICDQEITALIESIPSFYEKEEE